MENKDIKKINFFENYSYLDHNSVVIDLWANIGDVTNFIYNKYKCYIYAYEPNRACFNFMKERFLGNDKIFLYNNAVSNFTEDSFLYFHYDAKGNNDTRYISGATMLKEKDNIDINKKVKINVINIKEIISLFDKIDLIKIDVEGSEYNILPELIQNKNKINTVLCEMHGNPDGKKIGGHHKNRNFTKKYNETVLELKREKLYNSWFYEWH